MCGGSFASPLAVSSATNALRPGSSRTTPRRVCAVVRSDSSPLSTGVAEALDVPAMSPKYLVARAVATAARIDAPKDRQVVALLALVAEETFPIFDKGSAKIAAAADDLATRVLNSTFDVPGTAAVRLAAAGRLPIGQAGTPPESTLALGDRAATWFLSSPRVLAASITIT